jgi:hypothetical protein
MAYRRRRSTRFRRRRRGGFRGRSRFTRLARSVRFINKRLTTEVKKHDVNTLDATLDIAGTVFNLSSIAQGDTSSTREGNQIRAKYMNCMGTVTTSAYTVRLVVVQDLQMTPATPPTVAQIFESADPRTLMNRQSATAGRFNIVWDRLFTTYPGSTTEIQTHAFRFYKRLDRKPYMKMTWTDGTNTNFQNGHFFLVALTSVDEMGALDANFRIGFYDN